MMVDHSVSGAAASHCRACDIAYGLSLMSVTAMERPINCTIKFEVAMSRSVDTS